MSSASASSSAPPARETDDINEQDPDQSAKLLSDPDSPVAEGEEGENLDGISEGDDVDDKSNSSQRAKSKEGAHQEEEGGADGGSEIDDSEDEGAGGANAAES